jgi:hypothetical protein
MCPLCGALLTEHWADPDGPGARRGRVLRTRIVRRVLAGFGVTLSDWGGTAYVLHDGKGRAEVVHDLTTLWAEAERLAGRPLDPLDPALVAALRRDG